MSAPQLNASPITSLLDSLRLSWASGECYRGFTALLGLLVADYQDRMLFASGDDLLRLQAGARQCQLLRQALTADEIHGAPVL